MLHTTKTAIARPKNATQSLSLIAAWMSTATEKVMLMEKILIILT